MPSLPFVSIVIPAYNAAPVIQRCIAPLLTQTYPRDRYEIIVVDDGSTDDLACVLRGCMAGWTGEFHFIQQANRGPAAARNAGSRVARGNVVAFTDADCCADPDWIEQVVAALQIGGADAVGGPIHNAAAPGWVAEYLTSGKFFRHRLRRGRVDYLLTANLAVARPAFECVGGFIEERGAWGEDADLSYRLKQEGYGLIVADRGVVTHYGTPATIRGLARDLFRYGRGNYLLSHRWGPSRAPVVELARHGIAAVLAPALALALARARQVGTCRALGFVPLVALEHGAFVAGMLSAMCEDAIARVMAVTARMRRTGGRREP